MNDLWPLHSSVPEGGLRGIRGMTLKPMPPEQREFVEDMALSIFADMTNAGRPFQQALAAIYLSGINHALQAATGGGDA